MLSKDCVYFSCLCLFPPEHFVLGLMFTEPLYICNTESCLVTSVQQRRLHKTGQRDTRTNNSYNGFLHFGLAELSTAEIEIPSTDKATNIIISLQVKTYVT